VKDEARNPIWTRGAEHRAERAGVGEAKQCSALRPDRVEHGGEVVDELLEGGKVVGGVAVRDPSATAIHDDQP
jgi:hypothetical protein